jgi:hypothetical protein
MDHRGLVLSPTHDVPRPVRLNERGRQLRRPLSRLFPCAPASMLSLSTVPYFSPAVNLKACKKNRGDGPYSPSPWVTPPAGATDASGISALVLEKSRVEIKRGHLRFQKGPEGMERGQYPQPGTGRNRPPANPKPATNGAGRDEELRCASLGPACASSRPAHVRPCRQYSNALGGHGCREDHRRDCRSLRPRIGEQPK